MGRIIVSENITLDGVMQDPTGEEGSEFGGWFTRISPAEREAWGRVGGEEAAAAEALLLGRRTYEFLVRRWATREGAWADRLRSIPKYVVSSAPVEGWPNTTVVDVDAAAKLKQEIDGDIVVNASGQLVRALLDQELVDEVRLMLFPLVAGGGARMAGFGPRRLIGNRAVGDTLVLLTYAG